MHEYCMVLNHGTNWLSYFIFSGKLKLIGPKSPRDNWSTGQQLIKACSCAATEDATKPQNSPPIFSGKPQLQQIQTDRRAD